MRRWALTLAVMLAITATGPAGAFAASATITRSAPATTQPNPQRDAAIAALSSIEALLIAGKPREALGEIAALRPVLISLEPLQNRDLYRAAACARRMAQLASISDDAARLVPDLAREHRKAMHAFAFAFSPAADHPEPALAVLAELAEAFPRDVDRYANLAAAIAVVRDAPETADETAGRVPEPADLFGYFIRNDRRMAISPRNLPPELLIYVADAAAPVDELQWALDRYAKQGNIGARFFDVPYDDEYFRSNAGKQIDDRGYTLPNLVRFGGVCSDQAYFASTIAKSMGIPATSVSGMGSEVGHAWVGYVETRGRSSDWNLENGRYDAYKGIRGQALDPQTGKRIFEGELRLLTELIDMREDDRLDAIGIADIAGFEPLANTGRVFGQVARPRASTTRRGAPQVDSVTPERVEYLLRTAIDLSPACMDAWSQVRRIAPRFGDEQRIAWSSAVARLCARSYPDFAVTVVGPMIEALPDPDERDRAWQAAGKLYGQNVDVAADIAMAQARNWAQAGKENLALRRCEQVVQTCGESGSRVLEALVLAEQVLRSSGREDEAVELYRVAFDNVVVPDGMSGQFVRQTPWYRVGSRYGYWLERIGDDATAAKLARRLQNLAGPTREEE